MPFGNGKDQRLAGGRDIKVPVYTVRKKDGEEEWDIMCSHEEAKQTCEEYGLVIVPKFPAIVSGTGSLLSKTDGGWKDNLKRIKSGAGKGNTIKV